MTSGILRGVPLSIVGSAHAGISLSVRSYVCFGLCLPAKGLVSAMSPSVRVFLCRGAFELAVVCLLLEQEATQTRCVALDPS